ncbi:hypothetical protein V8J88_03785 [Massilia sp. W12]|uniref:hypothetical protein n=1 Tax=Massilia sp. W12 TaxID=3126507 RepID=UPI0030D0E075
MKKVVMALPVLLAACATPPPPVNIPVPVQMPAPVLCVKPAQIPEDPDYATAGLPSDAGIWQQMSALRAERIQRRLYGEQLKALVRGCAGL